jgi:predicted ribosomally synthesized peptide with nif11-like leader
MSKTEAEDFLAKMLGDEAFRDSVIQIEDVKKKIEFLYEQGFSFTSDELEDASESMPAYAII